MSAGATVHKRTGRASDVTNHPFPCPQAYHHLHKEVHFSKLVPPGNCCLGASLLIQSLQVPQRHHGCHPRFPLLSILWHLHSGQRHSQLGLQGLVLLHHRPLIHTARMWRSEWYPCITVPSIVHAWIVLIVNGNRS
jgi:hypothetical protein